MSEQPAIERTWDAPSKPPKPPMPGRRKAAVIGAAIVGAVALMAVVTLSGVASNDVQRNVGKASNADVLKINAFASCQMSVEGQLKAPATADFPTLSGGTVSGGPEVYTIRSYVDAENSFGAMIRTPWTCTATQTGGSDYSAIATLG